MWITEIVKAAIKALKKPYKEFRLFRDNLKRAEFEAELRQALAPLLEFIFIGNGKQKWLLRIFQRGDKFEVQLLNQESTKMVYAVITRHQLEPTRMATPIPAVRR